MDSYSQDAAHSIRRDGVFGKRLLAIAIVFVMISTAFVALNVGATGDPMIWTSRDEYGPGEVVEVFGQGFAPFEPIEILIDHPDIDAKSYTANPISSGEFVFDGYVAEWVTQQDVPVTVTATQTVLGQTLTATTFFYDPAIYLEGWTIKPVHRFTMGNVWGYNEGDSVPMILVLDKNQLGGEDEVTVTIAVDYEDDNSAVNPTHAFDYLTEVWWVGNPEGPYNIYPESSTPFKAQPGATVTEQHYVGIEEKEGPGQTMLVWEITVAFDAGDTLATVMFGAHLAVSDLTSDPIYKGASYYPGAAVHVMVLSDKGIARDVPVVVEDVCLTPPEMTLEKECDPTEVVFGDEITFEITWSNIGQADAQCINLWDVLPDVIDIDPTSFLMWTSTNPSKMAPSPGPTLYTGGFEWYLGPYRGTGVDDHLDPLVTHLSFTGTVNTDQEGCYHNDAYMSYGDDHGGDYDDLFAQCWFCIKGLPAIDVVKTGPDYAHYGDTITYTYTVTNTGLVDLIDVDVVDDMLGPVTTDDFLAAGETVTYTMTHTVVIADSNPLVNTVIATGEDDYDRIVTDEDSWTVEILNPEIEVTKEADMTCGEVGETIWYTIVVTNPSDHTDLYNVVVDDSLLGTLMTGGTLLAGSSEDFVVSFDVTEEFGDPMVNEVTATGEDMLGLEVSDHARVDVDVKHPAIEITKEGSMECGIVGETVTYWINVSNPSPDTDMYIMVYDYMFSGYPLVEMWLPWGGVWESGPLTHVISPNDDDNLVNTARVDAYDDQNHRLSKSATWTVDIYHPMIIVEKEASMDCAAEGDVVTYTITLTNPSTDTPLTFELYDDLLGGLIGSGVLDSKQTIVYNIDYDVPYIEAEPRDWELYNYVHVDAWDPQGHYVGDSDECWVDIYHPEIVVEKTPDMECAAEGDTVIYTIVVTNPTIDTPMYYDLYDPLLGGYIGSGTLAAGASKTYTLKYPVPAIPADPAGFELYNFVYVDAWDPQDHYAYASDECWVDIYHPEIIIEKTPNTECAAEGDVVIYRITVTNPSIDTPMDYEVVDQLLGGTIGTGTLGPMGSIEIIKDYTVPYIAAEPRDWELYNFVEVFAVDPQGHTAYDWDECWVDIYHPGIVVEKSADMECAAEGDTVIYTIVVTNPTIDTPMYYDLNDPLLGGYVYSGYLLPGESDVYDVPYLVPDIPADPTGGWELYNFVEVFAVDPQGHTAYDSAECWVDIYHPAIMVDKSADLTCAAEGDVVTYTIVVTNPTVDTPMYCEVFDPMFADEYKDGIIDQKLFEPGESKTYTIEYIVPYIAPDPLEWELYNMVEVWAWDPQEHFVLETDFWLIDIYHPGIDLVKTVDMTCAAEGETVVFTLTVTNPTDETPMYYDLYDTLLGLYESGYLLPGESDVYNVPYTVPVTEMVIGEYELYNFAYVEAWDPQLHEAYDRDGVYVDVVHPSIDIVKWSEMSCAHDGEEISYQITVTNTGDTWLNGTIYDDLLDLSVPFADLRPGEQIVLSPDYTVPVGSEWIVNEAWVEAWDHQDHRVMDDASWTYEILHPEIDVEKTGPEYANAGDIITYTVVVTNTGDTDLLEVGVDDSLIGPIAYYPTLAVGETQTITYTYTVPSGEGIVHNEVLAWGWDRQTVYAEDFDDWDVMKYSKIVASKFADLDQDGVWSEHEPGVESWVIDLVGQLDDGTWDNRTRLTDSSGYFEFTNLQAGVYTISEAMVTGWQSMTTTTYTLTVGSGTLSFCTFGNVPLGTISGSKWWDHDLDGIWDEGEEGIEGWTIYLMGDDANGDYISLSMTTDANGDYTFSDLLPGLYTVYEEDRYGWYPTTASNVIVDTSLTLDTFTVVDVDFGNAKYGSVTGYKWLDEYMNGYWDGDELRLEGWTIWLEGEQVDGEPIGPISTTTDENGNYAFLDLLPGVYTVWEELPDGWYAVTPASREVTLIEGSDVTCAKFGNVEYGSISGWKFLDWDMDGMMDGDEPGIPGWAMTLTGWLNDGALPYPMPGWTDSATSIGPITIYTDADGYWEFPDLLPGVYIVTEEDRADWYNTLPQTVTLIVRSGSDLYDIKFGNVPYTCLWGFKYEDVNGNGVWDEGEPGLPGWTIVVEGYTNDGEPVHIEMVTDETGYWATCYNVLPGTYTVYELSQEGWIATTLPEYRVPMQMCMEPMDYYFEFGNFELGKISGYKYEDMNGDGILDDGDVPILGWTIYLDGPVYGQTTTDENGYYEFTGLMAGMYSVSEESLAGWVHTTPPSYELTISSGDEVEIPVFLNVELSRISGYKFNDLNSDGVWDEGEPGIRGWTIYMVWDADPMVYSTTTDKSGYYEFTGLMPDLEYVVWEEDREGWTPTTPAGWIVPVISGSDIRVPDFGNFENVDITVFKFEDVNSDGVYDEGDDPLPGWEFIVTGPGVPGGMVTLVTGVDGFASVEVAAAGPYVVEEVPQDMWCPTTPTVQDVSVLSGYVDPEVVVFGNYQCVEITIFKYEDVNSNGVYDDDDRPLPGWEFTFYGVDQSSFVMETDIDGLIHVTLCGAGYWDIVEEMPEDWCPVEPLSGMVSIWVQSGLVVNLDTQEEQYVFEFGNFHGFELKIFKFLDSCSNGYYDPELDTPLEGWYFEIIGPSYPDGADGWTDENGELSFWICRAGTYIVTEEQRDGWSAIQPLSGSYEVYVESGEIYIELWFANYEDVDVPVFKYEDVNSNGVWDKGEPGIEGWYFELVRNDDMQVFSGYTDENGMLMLTVNRSGVYTLVEEDREGWTPVNPDNGMRLVNIVSGIEVPLQMFGNFHDVTILVFKFDDIYGDGRYSPDQGDVPIAGWVFELYMLVGDAWVLVDTQATDGDGIIEFVVDQAGTYKVLEESQDGWIHIMPDEGYYIVDSYSGMDEVELWFANFKFGMIFGWKWNDLNGDGVWDEGEPGLPGWTIHMEGYLVGYGYIYDDATTDENGYYQFTGLPPGDYIVWEDGQTGWIPTSPPEVQLYVTGHSIIQVDFLNFELGCIEGYKYEDMNGNGILDEGDQPIEDWTIYLSQLAYSDANPEISGIVLIDMVTTDEFGHYMFCGLGPGTYVVSEESREGWIQTTEPSETVDMTSGATIVIHDFLNFELGMVCGWKFEDKNSNGVWDEGEPGLSSWPIHMVQDSVQYEWIVYTGTDGYFSIDGLMAGEYLLWEELLPGWTPTTETWAEFTITSGAVIELDPFGNFKDVYIPLFKYEDVDGNGVYNEGDYPIEGWMFTVSGPCFDTPVQVYTDAEGKAGVTVTMAGTYLIVEEDRAGWMHVNPSDGTATAEVVSGMMFKTFQFGNFREGQITGQKFYDWNMNGVMDEGEPGLANWVIWINGTLVSGGTLDITRLTDSNGFYSVTGLPAGTYVVSERLEYGLPGWQPTTPASKTVVVNSGTISSLSFGNAVYGVVHGWKFYDKDMDGVFDENEVGLGRWTIVLEGYTDEGLYVYRTTVTGEDGWYFFDMVQPGEYTVSEILQPGWENTTPLPVVVDASGLMQYFDARVDIGNIRYAVIHGYKFLDTYAESYPFWPNGLFDDDEVGLGNWEITLEGETTSGELVQRVVYTDNMKDIGYYEFDDVLPGTYWVNETLLFGFYATRPISNLVMVYPFPFGPVEMTIDFGNLIPELDPELNFVLNEGWNLWSCPMEVEDLTAKELLDAIGSAGLVVSKLSKVDDRYYSYAPGAPERYDFPIVRGVGYFVYVTEDTVFSLRGEFGPADDAPLGAGWNIVGFSQLKHVMASEFLSMVDGGNALVVSYLDAEEGRYYSYSPGAPDRYDFVVSPGRAYFVWVDVDAMLVF